MAIEAEKAFLAILQMVPGIGSARLRKLVSYFGSGKDAWQATEQDLRCSGCIDQPTYDKLIALRPQIDLDKLVKKWEDKQVKLCVDQDTEYPDKLKNIFNPPVVLFYRGTIAKNEKRIAIVGARKASAYGQTIAKTLAGQLAVAGVEVVSGAARGIDTAAHWGSLETGKTIAVLGCGVDVNYPPENKKLLDEIAEKGLVLSEYAPGTVANAKFFPARNRIITGLSDGVVVVEAALKSGSLITAEFALNEGRDVFAVPGNVFSDSSKGCHKLIKQGAKLVEGVTDILEEYSWQNSPMIPVKMAALSKEELCIYQLLTYDIPIPVDEIILKTRSDASNITFILLQMELRGLIVEHSPHCYLRAIKEGVL